MLSNRQDLKTHKENVHNIKTGFTCKICKESFQTKLSLSTHTKTHELFGHEPRDDDEDEEGLEEDEEDDEEEEDAENDDEYRGDEEYRGCLLYTSRCV